MRACAKMQLCRKRPPFYSMIRDFSAIHYKNKENKHEKQLICNETDSLCCIFSAGNCTAISDRTDSDSRKYAFANAYSGTHLRFCLRLAVGTFGGLCPSAYEKAPLFYASDDADRPAMAFELAVYGAVTGILYQKLPKTTVSVYVSLAGAMIAGRIVWGIVSMVSCMELQEKLLDGRFSWGGALLNAVPGIILQLVLIPIIILALRRAKFMD